MNLKTLKQKNTKRTFNKESREAEKYVNEGKSINNIEHNNEYKHSIVY